MSEPLRADELDYELPESAIATRPADPRDSARLMVVERRGSGVSHRHVRDLPAVLGSGDLLVFNRSRVVPARFVGRRVGTGGRVEGLYLHDAARGPGVDAGIGGMRWVVLLRSSHLRPDAEVELPAGVRLRVVGRSQDEPQGWDVEVSGEIAAAGVTSEALLGAVGLTPLPPYIRRARKVRGEADEEGTDRERYQTVYAEEAGSVAAPTAGLHFTPELLSRLDAMGVERREVVLHVGAGTFRPVEAATVQEHPMHGERFEVPRETREAISRAKREGRRVVAVGTTTVRALESMDSMDAAGESGPRQTRILIAPGWRFRWVDGLMTNFHLPRSTLMALVGAMLEDACEKGTGESNAGGAAAVGGGVSRLRACYAEAIARGYRFYSYGDAMLIV